MRPEEWWILFFVLEIGFVVFILIESVLFGREHAIGAEDPAVPNPILEGPFGLIVTVVVLALSVLLFVILLLDVERETPS